MEAALTMCLPWNPGMRRAEQQRQEECLLQVGPQPNIERAADMPRKKNNLGAARGMAVPSASPTMPNYRTMTILRIRLAEPSIKTTQASTRCRAMPQRIRPEADCASIKVVGMIRINRTGWLVATYFAPTRPESPICPE